MATTRTPRREPRPRPWIRPCLSLLILFSLLSPTATASGVQGPQAVGAADQRSLAVHSKKAVLLTGRAARGKDDYDDDDYGDDDDDDDDDYDYYGTKKKKPKPPAGAAAAVSPSETNVFNFVRIMVLRIVWGFASLFGFEEPLSEAFNGAFVPPGVDDYGDDDGLGLDY